MSKYTEDIFHKIRLATEGKCFSICALLSNKGYGKLTLAKQFIESHGYNYITINRVPEHFNHLYPLLCALKESTTDYYHLHLKIIQFLDANPPSALIFSGSESYQEELLRIITEVSSFYINNTSDASPIVFLFLINDTQPPASLDKYFAEFSQYVNYIPFERWKENDLLEIFRDKYPECNYLEKDMEQIISLSFSNPGDFISNLEELKRKGIFIRNNDETWQLSGFNPDVLSCRMVRVVQERFEKLDDNLKEAIQKASIIGKEFDSKTLENPLKVIRAQQLLMQIEDISQLIYTKLPDKTLYSFENDEAYLSIDGYVKESDRKIWNRTIAEYFANEIKYEYMRLDEQKIDELLRKVAYYYKKAEDYKESITYYMKLISRCFANSNYSQVIMLVKDIKQFPKKYLTNKTLRIALIYSMESNEVLCDFTSALNDYYEFERYSYIKNNVLSWGLIKKAYYLYYANKVPEAYSLLQFIKEEKEPCTLTNAKLYVNGFSMLSAIGETVGSKDYIKHYNYALTLSKKFYLAYSYYNLLRKANAVHPGKIGIDMMLEAYYYFRNKNKYMHAMTAHNIGTEYAQIMKRDESLNYLQEARQLFKELGSTGQLVTLNSIAVYTMIFEHDFVKALSILKNLDSFDGFQKLALLNNTATCKRKLGYLDEAEELIAEITKINNKEGNQFAWYKECLILQNAYLCKAQGRYEDALGHFSYYIENQYGIIKPNKVSVIKNIIFLSHLLNKPLTKKVERMKNAYDICGQSLYENDLMYADLMFWE